MNRQHKFDVFLSHSSTDEEFVRLLDQRLRAAGVRTFCYETDVPWGANIPSAIEKAVEDSRHLILVLSPEAVKSKWVDIERCLQLFKSLSGRDGAVLPLLRIDCDIPLSIQMIRYLHVRNDQEFAAAWPKMVQHLISSRSGLVNTELPISSTSVQSRVRERAIAIICPLFGASRIFYTELIAAINERAKRLGYELLIVPISEPCDKRPLVFTFPQLVTVSGVIFMTCQVENSTWLDECASLGIPAVLLHDNIPPEKAKSGTVVSYIWPRLDSLEELVQHLAWTHGANSIAAVMVSSRDHALRTEKLAIIERTMNKLNLAFSRDSSVFVVKEYSHNEGVVVVDRILEKMPSTDAIVCLSDTTAIGILERLTQLGLRRLIRVTGFDNIEMSNYGSAQESDEVRILSGFLKREFSASMRDAV
jgi:DNA-binding LacI/PurR family transcriptional regulator